MKKHPPCYTQPWRFRVPACVCERCCALPLHQSHLIIITPQETQLVFLNEFSWYNDTAIVHWELQQVQCISFCGQLINWLFCRIFLADFTGFQMFWTGNNKKTVTGHFLYLFWTFFAPISVLHGFCAKIQSTKHQQRLILIGWFWEHTAKTWVCNLYPYSLSKFPSPGRHSDCVTYRTRE